MCVSVCVCLTPQITPGPTVTTIPDKPVCPPVSVGPCGSADRPASVLRVLGPCVVGRPKPPRPPFLALGVLWVRPSSPSHVCLSGEGGRRRRRECLCGGEVVGRGLWACVSRSGPSTVCELSGDPRPGWMGPLWGSSVATGSLRRPPTPAPTAAAGAEPPRPRPP